jgi:hypothetical protein
MRNLYCLLILLLALLLKTTGHAEVVSYRAETAAAIAEQQQTSRYFLLSNGVAKEIPDKDTLEVFGYGADKHHHIKPISKSLLSVFRFGTPVEPLTAIGNKDEDLAGAVRFTVAKNHALQSDLVLRAIAVPQCETSNAGCAVILWQKHNHLLLVRSDEKQQISFSWLDNSSGSQLTPADELSKLSGMDLRLFTSDLTLDKGSTQKDDSTIFFYYRQQMGAGAGIGAAAKTRGSAR